MRVFAVAGTAVGSDINGQAKPFLMNVCALSKTDAYKYTDQDMRDRGFRGVVVHGATDLGTASPTHWSIGGTLLIS